MKKWILSVAFFLALGGYATAQKQTSDSTKKQQTRSKSSVKKKAKDSASTVVVKADTSSYKAKIRINLPPADTTGMIPRNKGHKDE